jgi:hypothetical protein
LFGISKTEYDKTGFSELIKGDGLAKLFTKEQMQKPSFVLDVFLSQGFSRGYAMSRINRYNLGRVIISSDDPGKSFEENLRISKVAYKKAIQECLDVYQDKSIDYRDIKKYGCDIYSPPGN